MKNKKAEKVLLIVVFLLSLLICIDADDTNTFFGKDAGHSNTTGNYNTFFGCQAGYTNASGKCNTFVGYRAGYKNTTGFSNIFLGYKAGYSNTNGTNMFIGYCAGYKNTRGNYNTFLGYEAGYFNKLGKRNTFLGYRAGYNSTGSANTFLGFRTGTSNATGEYNTFVGFEAGLNNTYDHNTFVGYRAGYKSTTGISNTFVGSRAGYSNTDSKNNTFLGYQAGYSSITGTDNIFIGHKAGYNEGGSYKLYIAIGPDDSDVLIYGDFKTRCIGIATTTLDPAYRLVVDGKVRAQGFDTSSDVRLKSEVTPIKNALDQITHLRGVKFRWKDGKKGDGQHLGVIGQEVERVFPEVVSTDSKGYKSVAYSNLVAPLIEAVKELKAENETLKAKIEALEKKMKD